MRPIFSQSQRARKYWVRGFRAEFLRALSEQTDYPSPIRGAQETEMTSVTKGSR